MYEMIFGISNEAWNERVGADTVFWGFQFLCFLESGLWVEEGYEVRFECEGG